MKKLHVLCCLASGFLPGTLLAQVENSATVAVGVERIENPALTAISPGGVTVLRVAPSYQLEVAADRSRSRLTLGATLERSSNTLLLASRNYPNLRYTWDYSWPTSALELRAGLAESATRDTELQDLGRITTDTRERTVEAGLRWTQELTRRTRLSMELVQNKVSYDSDLLVGYRESQLTSRFSWEASERMVYYVEPAYIRLRSSGTAAGSTQTRWLAGMRGELAPGWTVEPFAGQARTSGPPSSTGAVAGIRLDFDDDRLVSGVDWSRALTPSAATSSYVRTESLSVRLGYRLTEGATLSAGLSHSRSEGIGGSRGRVAGLTLDHELGAHWAYTLGLEDRRTQPVGGAWASGWALRAGLVYAHPGR